MLRIILYCNKYAFWMFNLIFVKLQYAPFKDTKKRTLAAKAKELGLEEPALKLIEGSYNVPFGNLVNKEIEGLESTKSIELGIQHVIADVIGKNKDNVDKMDEL